MNLPWFVFAVHLVAAVAVFGIGLFVGVNGNSIQIVFFAAIAVMIGLLGRSARNIAARR
ncbi:hypothetical protein I7X12_20495 [Halosimplex litoreum]|jgi:hypothetical protein|uniref:Uncharacterized protein n=1 Tax=Halosimplex litoreum TaxID=1198301 RepID=A0A7T3KV99_9EURY|nr:hypothetical protein [Halosimplex litoreum]QPV63057.1 hypothetical protein I7X12_20495 [Halosimplex litoreum]